MRVFLSLLTVAAIYPRLFGQQTTPAPSRPAYEVLRQNEDWSTLGNGDLNAGDGFFDPVKYVRLKDDGSIWASFGGQVRERVESWNQFNFGAPTAAVHDDGFLLSRLLLHSDWHIGRYLRLFVQEKSAFSTHRALVGGRRTLDVDELDLQNAFVDLSFPLSETGRFTFRAGRQEMLFGKQRLVGPSDWANTRRTFDGFSGIFKMRNWTISTFWTRPVVTRKYDFSQNNPHTNFYGIYATGRIPSTNVNLDVYWLGLKNRSASLNGTVGHENRQTLGSRVASQIARSAFDYEVEGAYQFGKVGASAIRAFMVASQVGYTFRPLRASPRPYVGVDYASGDRAKGGNVGTFNQLFPSSHLFLGCLDIVGRQNILAFSSGVALKPLRRLAVALGGYDFWRASANDALYSKTGSVLRPGSPRSSRSVGVEGDLALRYQLDPHTVFEVGYGHFFPGEFIRRSGPHQPVEFGYFSAQYTF